MLRELTGDQTKGPDLFRPFQPEFETCPLGVARYI